MNDLNSLVFAYIGDAIYELYVREYLISMGIKKVDILQKEAVKYVSASSQEKKLQKLLDKNLFTEEELEILKRAKNHKVHSKPKSVDYVTYKNATALEAVFGYLYLNKNIKRIEKLVEYILEE